MKYSLISVVTENDIDILQTNIKYTRMLNKGKDINWILVCNNKNQTFLNMKKSILSFDTSKNDKIEFIEFKFSVPVNVEAGLFPSFEHAQGIHTAIKANYFISDKFVIIDPDFIMIMDNWLENLDAYMVRGKKQIIGTSWDPAAVKDWIDFPAPHFQMISCEIMSQLDYTPSNLPRKKFSEISQSNTFEFNKFASHRFETGYIMRDKFSKLTNKIFDILVLMIYVLTKRIPIINEYVSEKILNLVPNILAKHGIIFQHLYSIRMKKAIRKIKSYKFWFIFPQLLFRFLILEYSNKYLKNLEVDSYVSKMEFLAFDNKLAAIHARGARNLNITKDELNSYLLTRIK